jgi:anthranilate/para-aminobenzoate synthase component I
MAADLLPPLLRAARQHHAACFVMDRGPGETWLTWTDRPALEVGAGWPAELRGALRDACPREGGLVGWIGYEAGAAVEEMPAPRDSRPLPDLGLWPVAGFIELGPTGPRVLGGARFQAEAERLLRSAPSSPPSPPAGPLRPLPRGPARGYAAAVRRALRHIADGDCYQINLAWEARGLPCPDGLDAWLRLRRLNPARRGAWLRAGAVELVSNSPETYLDVEPGPGGLRATSTPIKGTAPRRAGAPPPDALVHSEKELAELTMIVDMVRNDLGRVAEIGGVEAGPREIVACGDLWHAEQTVRARLRAGVDAIDALAATFPPASVTGAPKVRAMQIIRALERGPRGVYTGAIGALRADGRASFSVAIRTAIVAAGRARFHVGAGIVADSSPEAEWLETRAKGEALCRHLQGA